MKKNYIVLILTLFTILGITKVNGQENNTEWTRGWTNFQPNLERYREAEIQISSIITEDLVLTNNKTYFMTGNVYVIGSATLTIAPGTVIRCDSKNPASLIVSKNAKLIAEGDQYNPIIFTSNKPSKSRKSGDWGGIVILGNGKLNSPAGVAVVEGNFSPQYSLYGGDIADEETAILKYVRIEFPGHKINESKELNGLTLCGIGSKTIIENVMVSYSADDSFEWFGGEGAFKNLVSFKSKDDDFDVTNGFKGSLTDILSVRHPYISDISGSYAIEVDGYTSEVSYASNNNLSYIEVKNATLINLASEENIPFIKAAISAKKLARISIESSTISGYAHVVELDKTYLNIDEVTHKLKFKNNLFNISNLGIQANKLNISNTNSIFSTNIFTAEFKSPESLFRDPLNTTTPSFALKSTEIKNKKSITLNNINE
ncbi:hypothetical protein [Tamlana sp. I1]|uniref:hypothetical protein n=1 Tax=Tamlana sp. I1 TaxID=2762061 RepID=UPI001890AF88|nr:hypothetical protein [Tamlana sp. I1]